MASCAPSDVKAETGDGVGSASSDASRKPNLRGLRGGHRWDLLN